MDIRAIRKELYAGIWRGSIFQHGGRKRAARQTKPIPPNAAEHFHMFLFT